MQRVRPVLERLADEFDETANLAVCRGGQAVNVDQAMGRSPLMTYDWIGNATPLHATASGKIMLAAMSPAERSRALGRRPLPRTTDATLTSRRELDAELRTVAETVWPARAASWSRDSTPWPSRCSITVARSSARSASRDQTSGSTRGIPL